MKRTLCGLFMGVACTGALMAQQDHAHTSAPAPAPAPVATTAGWSSAPLLLPQRGGGRGAARVALSNIAADTVSVFAPGGDEARRRVEYGVADGRADVRAAAPGMGNYHWVQVRDEGAELVRVASTVVYFSNPGDAPTALLEQPKSELEIVPLPLPREHASYRESEKWRFLVRWRGQPLAGQTVVLETENGSRSNVISNDHGVATVVFPRDFDPGKLVGGHGRPKAGFVLGATFENGGRVFQTAFNHVYSPEPERSRSLGWGVAFGLLGALIALPLLRRKDISNG